MRAPPSSGTTGAQEASRPAPAPAPEAAFDHAAGLERLMGDQAMYLRILTRFRQDYRDQAVRLHAALVAGDLPLAQRIAHTLKGAAAMIEARALRRLSVDIEHQLRDGATVALQLVDRLGEELARVIAQLDTLLQPAACTAPAIGAQLLGAEEIGKLCEMLDIGDSAAQDFIEDRSEGLHKLLGAARMVELEAAVAAFDFEGALRILRPESGH